MKIICVGRNYIDHIKELNNTVPKNPVLFMKPQSAVLKPGKPLYYPEFTDDLQYECEVLLKICKNGKHITKNAARHYFNEVSVGIDFTARDIQNELKNNGLPWELAKAFDGSAVVGTFLPVDDFNNIHSLQFHLDKNGTTVQQGNTEDMMYKFQDIISYASQYFMLNIGDIIFTGTPSGVGQANVYDNFQGFLEGEQLFNINIQ